MCKFCEGLFKEGHEIIWNMRNEYCDSNFCEKIFNNECSSCSECSIFYKLRGWKNEQSKKASIQCEYKFDNGEIVMWNFTEPLNINYCPYCGKQLSEKKIDFDDIGSHVVDMEDKNGESWDYELYKIVKNERRK